MPDQRTEVGFVVDTSGSMGKIWDEIFSGLKGIVTDLQAGEDAGSYRLTLVPFDTVVPLDLPMVSQPLTEIDAEEAFESLHPGGMTALNDGIGRCLDEMEKNANDETAYLIYIFSDGHENQSREYPDGSVINKRIEKLNLEGNWTISFIGCNQVAEDTAAAYAMPTGNAVTFRGDVAGTTRAMNAVRGATVRYATMRTEGEMGTGELFTAEDKAEVLAEDTD